MAPLALALAVLLCPAARAHDARSQAQDAAVVPLSGDAASARDAAGRPFDGNPASETVVTGREANGSARLAKASPVERAPRKEPPPAGEGKGSSKLTSGLVMGGAAVLGGLQGWFAAGLLGAAAGAGLGLAAAWLFHKKDYGGAFGVTAGAIIGTAFGGPIGGLIGAVVGGVIGHFLGKLFL